MEIILLILAVIAAILLILIVLIQPGKADMISGMGGLGGQMTNLLGHRQSRNILQNATIILLVSLVVISLLVNKVFLSTSEGGERSAVSQGVEVPTAPAAIPTQQTPAQQQPAAPAQPAEQGK